MLSTKCLDKLSIRTRFHMRMTTYQFSITHVPGKALTTADALSRAPLTLTTSADEQLTID